MEDERNCIFATGKHVNGGRLRLSSHMLVSRSGLVQAARGSHVCHAPVVSLAYHV